jgi:hypothetical protein
MNMKNNKKKSPMMKIVSAAAMLAVSASMLGTSTYAWFTMNKEVTVASMGISAKSNNPHLVVADTRTGTYGESVTLATPDPAKVLNLVTPLNVASNVPYYADVTAKAAGAAQVAGDQQNTNTTTPSKFTGASSVLWGTEYSSNAAQVQGDKIPVQVGTANLGDYVYSEDLYFKVLDNTEDATNLKLESVTFNDGTNSIAASGRILAVAENGKYQLFKLVDGVVTTAESGSDAALYPTVTKGGDNNANSVMVTIYFYFDGTDSSAYTNNATDLSQVTASYLFSVDADTVGAGG